QDDERRQREFRNRLQANDVGLDDGGVIARPPERQAEQRSCRRADEKAENGRAEGEADVGPGIAGGEEDRQRVGNRARLRPEESIDPAGAGADFPKRERADKDADLRGDERPGRPILLHRQAPDCGRPRRFGLWLRPIDPCHCADAGSVLNAHWSLPLPQAASFTGSDAVGSRWSSSRQRSLMTRKSGLSVLPRTRGRASGTGIDAMMRPGRVPITWTSSER